MVSNLQLKKCKAENQVSAPIRPFNRFKSTVETGKIGLIDNLVKKKLIIDLSISFYSCFKSIAEIVAYHSSMNVKCESELITLVTVMGGWLVPTQILKR